MTQADKNARIVKKLKPKYEKDVVFNKLESRILDFKNSIPLIQMLKSGSITDRHWRKLMKETDTKIEGNIKTLTLE